jgi:hydroxymethylpyrimidine pyrophosphatase-like HAD family hydrolase
MRAGSMARTAAVFDVDNTLTPPRQLLHEEVAAAMGRLTVPFALAAGSNLEIVFDQFLKPLHGFGYRGSFDAFLCNGATRYHCECAGEVDVKVVDDFSIGEALGPALHAVLQVLEQSLSRPEFQLPPGLSVIGERIIDRKSMINLAPIGRPRSSALSDEARRNRDAFVEFDTQTGYRKRYLDYLRSELAPISGDKNLVVTYGGQTSFDIVIRGRDKTFPVRMLLEAGFSEVFYFGDALFEGGNDAAVLTMIEEWTGSSPCPVKAVQVDGPDDTLRHLRALGLLV